MNNQGRENRPGARRAVRRTPQQGAPIRQNIPDPKPQKKVKKHRSTAVIIRNIFIAALICALLVFLVLYLFGFRYMAYKVTHGEETFTVKYIGRVDHDGNPTSGRVIYPDKQAKVSARDNIISYSNGDLYSGGLLKMLKHGTGYMRFDNGDTYEGTFAYDVISGVGTYTYTTSGDVYTGEFYDGMRSGTGVFSWADGSKYEGGWSAGVRSGTGTYTAADGSVYEGEYTDDKPNGHGKQTYSDGSYYDGTFSSGVRSGEGTYVYANGDKYVGTFANDKPNGQGTYTWSSGRYYIGSFEDGLIVVGSGIAYEADGAQANKDITTITDGTKDDASAGN